MNDVSFNHKLGVLQSHFSVRERRKRGSEEKERTRETVQQKERKGRRGGREKIKWRRMDWKAMGKGQEGRDVRGRKETR